MMQFSEKMKRSFNIFLTALLVAAFAGVGEVSAQDGEKLFKANCSSCHKVDQNMTGPALKGVEERWAGKEELLYLWIKNPNAALETGDSYVKNLYNEWFPKGGLMPGQAVNDEEIAAILDYVKNWEPPVRETPTGADVVATAPVEKRFGYDMVINRIVHSAHLNLLALECAFVEQTPKLYARSGRDGD